MKELWVRAMIWSMLLVGISGCTSTPPTSGDALCAGTEEERVELARSLLIDGGDLSVTAGQALLSKLEAGCRSV